MDKIKEGEESLVEQEEGGNLAAESDYVDTRDDQADEGPSSTLKF